MDTAPKASGCFLGGTQEIFGSVLEDLLGGAAKAEDAKLPGAGIIPKPCPMERVGTETVDQNKHNCGRGTGATQVRKEHSSASLSLVERVQATMIGRRTGQSHRAEVATVEE